MSKADVSDPSKLSLLDLPPEIRRDIYNFAFSADLDSRGRPNHRKFIHHCDTEGARGVIYHTQHQSSYGLLATCRQLRVEALSIATKATDFDLRFVRRPHVKRNTHRQRSSPFHQDSQTSIESLSIGTLLHSRIASCLRFVTVQIGELRSDGSLRADISLCHFKWWPNSVQLEQLTVVAKVGGLPHVRGALPYGLSHRVLKDCLNLCVRLCDVQSIGKAGRIVLEAQRRLSTSRDEDRAILPGLTGYFGVLDDKSKQLFKNVRVEAWPTLGKTQWANIERNGCVDGAALVTVAMLSITNVTDENSGGSSASFRVERHNAAADDVSAETSLYKPFSTRETPVVVEPRPNMGRGRRGLLAELYQD